MATAMRSFLITAKRYPIRIGQIRIARSLGRRRYFNTSSSRHEGEVDKESGADKQSSDISSVDQVAEEIIKEDGDVQQDTSASVLLSKKELGRAFEEIIQKHGHILQDIPEELMEEFKRAPPFREPISRKAKPGALNMGMTPAENPIDDPEFEEDDITSMAHGQLEQHREFRHYARLAAWEMPLLTKMAKPFVPPTQKEVLRFRYTNYMGENHPAENKVVVEFCPADLPDLTDVQRDKLKKLAGSRWNPETDIIKMSCEMFETQAQNKRYLGDLVETLLHEARDPTDTFEDIPFDTRHHSIKIKPKFPVGWRMTDQRRAELEALRQRAVLIDQQKELQGTLVDGVQQIEAALARSAAVEVEREAQLVTAGKATSKSKKLKKR